MNEHLFKLKKDGKMVGYEKYIYCDQREGYVKGKSLVPQHSKDGKYWEYIYLWDLKTRPKGYWFEAHFDMDVYIEHDEKCPFVTKDKNGEDVFAGDKVIYRPPDIDELCEDEEEELEATVTGGFLIFDIEGTDFVEASKFGDIELIKE